MKKQSFYWAWNTNAAQVDKLMTRARAANLLRVWRRAIRQPANYRPFVSLERLESGVYRVTHECGEVAILEIRAA